MLSRLPEGIRKLSSGRYQARYPVTVNGKTTQRSAGTFAKLQDAKDARSLALAERRQGTWVDPSGPKMTFEAWAQKWLSLRGAKVTQAQSNIKVHFNPAFGQMRLGDITPIDVQHWVNDMTETLSPAVVNKYYSLFKRIMEAAVDFDVLMKSPCRTITLPTLTSKKAVPLDAAQLRLIEAKAPERFRAMIHLSAWCGLRWQEAAALRWENVDLSAGLLTVCEAIKTRDGQVGPPKNGKTRIVPLTPATVALLTAHRRDYGTSELLFPNRSGRLLSRDTFRRVVWLPLIKECGLEQAPTYHALRHAYAGHMVMQGMDPKLLCEILGHHSPAFTMERYGFLRFDATEVSIAAAERAMRG